MPTKEEVDLRRAWIADAIVALERRGITGRRPARRDAQADPPESPVSRSPAR